jgi:hypothetical protein
MFTLTKFQPEELQNSIIDRCNAVNEAITLEVPNQDIDGMVGKLNTLSSLTGTMATCVADAKRLIRHKQLEILKRESGKGHTPTVLNKTIETECGDEESLELYCDKLRSGLTGTINALVTMISLWKTELQENNKQGTIYKK